MGNDPPPKMETRSQKTQPPRRGLNEDELEALRASAAKQEERIRQQVAALERERADFEREREAERAKIRAEKENAQYEKNTDAQREIRIRDEATALAIAKEEFEAAKKKRVLEDKYANTATGADTHELIRVLKDEMLRGMSNLRAELNAVKINQSSVAGMPDPYEQDYPLEAPVNYARNSRDLSPRPKVSFREATEGVPIFDGYNVPLQQFIRACRRAREIVPPSSERNLTKLLINKLRERAYYAVEDEPCDSVADLIDLLSGAFGPVKTIDQCRGELSVAFMMPGEHMLDYISRIKDMRSAILDAERRQRGPLYDRVVQKIDDLTARSFCDGLPLSFRIQLTEECRTNLSVAFATAKTLAEREELDRERYKAHFKNAESWHRANSNNRNINTNDQSRPRFTSRDTRQRPENNTRGQNYSNNNNARGQNYNNNSNRGQDYNNDNNNRGQRYNNNSNNRAQNYNNNNNYQHPKNRVENQRAPVEYKPNNPETGHREHKYCNYCKASGHEWRECRKRPSNENPRQGNANGPSNHRDEPRAGPSQTRPVRIIDASPSEMPASASSE